MLLRGINHVGIISNDLDRLQEFYKKTIAIIQYPNR